VEHLTVGMPVLVVLIIIALGFDFSNGQHDCSNSIATIVATRVLRPKTAVMFASFFNFVAFTVFGLSVAATVGKGVIATGIADPLVVFGALAGAISWNLFTLWLGIPSSSSHALIGGLVGAGIAKAGLDAVVWGGLRTIAEFIVLSPLVGLACSMTLMLVATWTARRWKPFVADRRFRVLQLASCALLSLGHGGNDAQKTMGLISVLLYSQGMLGPVFHVPFWVVLSCQAAMAAGTLCGGWKIVHTMGSRITDLRPIQGVCAETGGALALFGATYLGIPVSSTHTIAGSVVGVGAARRASAVRWTVARRIVVAWLVTLPASAAVGAACYLLALLVYRMTA
jgi:PiT family inorganic phosphate transporter